LLQLIEESFSFMVRPLVGKALSHAGLRSDSIIAIKAGLAIDNLLQSAAEAQQPLETVIAECKAVVGAGTHQGDALGSLVQLLEAIGIDRPTALSGALLPALDCVWSSVGLPPNMPVLKKVAADVRDLAQQNLATIEAKFKQVKSLISARGHMLLS